MRLTNEAVREIEGTRAVVSEKGVEQRGAMQADGAP